MLPWRFPGASLVLPACSCMTIAGRNAVQGSEVDHLAMGLEWRQYRRLEERAALHELLERAPAAGSLTREATLFRATRPIDAMRALSKINYQVRVHTILDFYVVASKIRCNVVWPIKETTVMLRDALSRSSVPPWVRKVCTGLRACQSSHLCCVWSTTETSASEPVSPGYLAPSSANCHARGSMVAVSQRCSTRG